MNKYKIRLAEENDLPEILELIKDLAEFEKAGHKVTNTVEQMKLEKDLFGCFIAVDENNIIIGIALYFYAYYTWVGKSLYLEDLFVKPEYRNKGIGSALLNEIFKLAKTKNCKRLRWQVLKWNKDAIKLYQKMGAVIDGEWYNCDMDYSKIKSFD